MVTTIDAGAELFERVLRDMRETGAAGSRGGGATARDLLILLKIAAAPGRLSVAELASELGIALADVSLGLERCRRVGLVDAEKRRVEVEELLEFLTHGARYVFPAEARGRGRVAPLDPAAPRAAESDERLRRLLALADALRDGAAPGRAAAARELARVLREGAFS